jgi:hypothetical protein
MWIFKLSVLISEWWIFTPGHMALTIGAINKGTSIFTTCIHDSNISGDVDLEHSCPDLRMVDIHTREHGMDKYGHNQQRNFTFDRLVY